MSLSPWVCSTSSVYPLANTGSPNPPDTHSFRTLPICTQTPSQKFSHTCLGKHIHTRHHAVLNSPPLWTPLSGLCDPCPASSSHPCPPPAPLPVLSKGISVSITPLRPLWSWSPTMSYCKVPESSASPTADSPGLAYSPWMVLLSWVSSSPTG